jgi:hypothetical protein
LSVGGPLVGMCNLGEGWYIIGWDWVQQVTIE